MTRDQLLEIFLEAARNGKVQISLNRHLHLTDADFASVLEDSRFPSLSDLQVLELPQANLGNYGITALAASATEGKFTELTELWLDGTNLGDAGLIALAGAAKEGKLAKLRHLNLRDTKVGDLGLVALAGAVEKGNLTLLDLLDLHSSRVGDCGLIEFAEAVSKGKLTGLEWLNLGSTNVGDAGLIELAAVAKEGKLAKLEWLDLSKTNIGDTGLIELAVALKKGRLTELRWLDLHGTDVANPGLLELAEAADKGNLENLSLLRIDDTNVGNEGLDGLATVAKKGKLKNLLSLWLDATKINSVAEAVLKTNIAVQIFAALEGSALDEAKILVLGQPAVGKSWLCKRFFENEIPPEERVVTDDFELIDSQWQATVDERLIAIRVWDFGGQHILHGVHEAFFSDMRSVYLLVLDVTRPRTGTPQENEEKTNRIDYWLGMIRHFAGEPPTVIVVTKNLEPDDQKKLGDVSLEALKTEFGYDLSPAWVVDSGFDARIPLTETAAMEELQSKLTNALASMEALHGKIGQGIVALKPLVESKIADQVAVPVSKFREWCEECRADASLSLDTQKGLADGKGQDGALEILANLGGVLFLGLTPSKREMLEKNREGFLNSLPPGQQHYARQQRGILDQWVFNPHWLKGPLYEIFKDSESNRRHGWLTENEIRQAIASGLRLTALAALKDEKGKDVSFNLILAVLELLGICHRDTTTGNYLVSARAGSGKPIATTRLV